MINSFSLCFGWAYCTCGVFTRGTRKTFKTLWIPNQLSCSLLLLYIHSSWNKFFFFSTCLGNFDLFPFDRFIFQPTIFFVFFSRLCCWWRYVGPRNWFFSAWFFNCYLRSVWFFASLLRICYLSRAPCGARVCVNLRLVLIASNRSRRRCRVWWVWVNVTKIWLKLTFFSSL